MSGSRELRVGPFVIRTMEPAASQALEEAVAQWRDRHRAGWEAVRATLGGEEPPDEVYAFAYWLIRYSGLVAPVKRPPEADGEPLAEVVEREYAQYLTPDFRSWWAATVERGADLPAHMPVEVARAIASLAMDAGRRTR